MTIDKQSSSPAEGVKSLLVPGYCPIQDIQSLIRLTGEGNYTRIELAHQARPLLVSRTLGYFERQLPDFIRVSKSVLLNPHYVTGSRRQNSKTVYLKLADGSLILISRRRIAETIHKLRNQFPS